MLTRKLSARFGNSPMMMNSEVPIPKAATASAINGVRSRMFFWSGLLAETSMLQLQHNDRQLPTRQTSHRSSSRWKHGEMKCGAVEAWGFSPTTEPLQKLGLQARRPDLKDDLAPIILHFTHPRVEHALRVRVFLDQDVAEVLVLPQQHGLQTNQLQQREENCDQRLLRTRIGKQ